MGRHVAPLDSEPTSLCSYPLIPRAYHDQVMWTRSFRELVLIFYQPETKVITGHNLYEKCMNQSHEGSREKNIQIIHKNKKLPIDPFHIGNYKIYVKSF